MAVALATVLTMVLGFGVWLHHMFATGLPSLALSFFSAVSILIALPSAVSFFAWIATIWTGRLVFSTAPAARCRRVVVPMVASRSPLWEERLQETPLRTSVDTGFVLDEGKEAIASTVLDGQPDLIVKMPEDSILPLLLALALTAVFTGLILHIWWLVTAAGIIGLLLLLWLWPRAKLGQIARPADV